MNRKFLSYLITLVVIGFCIPLAGAEEQPVPAIEPRADRIIKSAGEYLKSADKFSVRANIEYDKIHRSGQLLQYSINYQLVIRRPDRIRAEIKSDWEKKRFWYNGKTITLQIMGKNIYTSISAPPKIDAALDYVMESFDVTLPLADLLFSDPSADLRKNIISGFYVGRHYVDGVRCHHLAFSQENIDWQFWIEDSVTPVPRKVVITYKQEEGSPQYVAYLSDWDFNLRLPDLVFEFEPPAGAREVKLLPPVGQPQKEEQK